MSNFLEVDDSIIANNLLLNGQPDNPVKLLQNFVGASGGGDLSSQPLLTPELKKQQEQCKFIIPTAGMCIKTKDNKNNTKFFMNLCHSSEVPEPDVNFTDEQLATILSEGTDAQVEDVRLPMSIGELHKDKDKNGLECLAVDVVINTRFYEAKVTKSEMYRTFLIVIALEGVDEKYQLELEKSKYTILHNRKSFGKLQPQFVRQKPSIREIKEESTGTTPSILGKDSSTCHTSPIVDPNTDIKRRRLVQELSTSDLKLDFVITQLSEELATVHVQLPNLRNPSKLFVRLGADRIIVESPTGCLDVFVPLDIHQEESSAEYDPEKKLLTINLPLI